ncbi:MAG TPA: glucokinase [Syntrophus sp. (in: bacteria)]|nr:glucokinase [Syntrophus sp. (in: bacteria)]
MPERQGQDLPGGDIFQPRMGWQERRSDEVPKTERHILAADIGGTNSRFAHFTTDEDERLDLVSLLWLKSAASGSFADLLKNLRDSDFPFDPGQADIVGIALAGLITGGVIGNPPHIPWDVDITHAGRDFGFRRTILINDFVAQAFSCISPIGKSAEIILPGSPEPLSAIAVIGAGTGLGKAMLVPDEKGVYSAAPSEGAHAGFPFIGEKEFAFQRFLISTWHTHYATYDHVVSARGLSAIHEFLTGSRLEPAQVMEQSPRHPETLEWFSRFYGRACRNFALETLSRGGLYIAGGVAARNPEIVHHEAFKREFLDSDVMSGLLAKLPIFLVSDQNSGLWGVAMKSAGTLAKDLS